MREISDGYQISDLQCGMDIDIINKDREQDLHLLSLQGIQALLMEMLSRKLTVKIYHSGG